MSGYLVDMPEVELGGAAAAPEIRENPPKRIDQCRAGDVVELERAGALIRVVVLADRQWGDRFVRPITPDGKRLGEPFTAHAGWPVKLIGEHYRW